jgi:hypothetical protein
MFHDNSSSSLPDRLAAMVVYRQSSGVAGSWIGQGTKNPADRLLPPAGFFAILTVYRWQGLTASKRPPQ